MDKSPDLLSDLPLDIIHVVLSFVPIRDAVRTSILSRQWRYVWSRLPQLDFDNTSAGNGSDKNRMIHFINQALLLHNGPIHKFQLRTPFMENYSCIDQWLLFLSRNDIRILVVECNGFHAFLSHGLCVHSSLYSCQKLTCLKLKCRDISPPPPSFKGFLFLRILNICMDQVPSSTIERIVAYSPLLEKITVKCDFSLEMTIRAPNLKYFYFHSVIAELSLCTPLLEEFTGVFFLAMVKVCL